MDGELQEIGMSLSCISSQHSLGDGSGKIKKKKKNTLQ
jgi:hypothetical protein